MEKMDLLKQYLEDGFPNIDVVTEAQTHKIARESIIGVEDGFVLYKKNNGSLQIIWAKDIKEVAI